VARNFIKRMAGLKVPPYEVEMVTKSGERLTIEINAVAIRREGKVIGDLVILRDMTERKQAEAEIKQLYEQVKAFNVELEDRIKERTRELEKAVKEAEAANQAKSEFLSGMSHELRTPLTAVIGFSQILAEQYFGELNEKQAEYVRDILESGEHLLSLINDILDLAKVEAGKAELELSRFNMKELLENSLVMIKEKTSKHSISLEARISPALDNLTITADQRRLKQVMFNLLSNAAKFTPDQGRITVEARRKGAELIVSVADTGIGIDPKAQEKIFDEFYQAHVGPTDKTPGTGLGLPLSKSFIEMHGGRIWVESEGKGKGSRFIFSLPLREAKKGVSEEKRRKLGEILIAEGHITQQELGEALKKQEDLREE
jgi:signal transduction histidine kinase